MKELNLGVCRMDWRDEYEGIITWDLPGTDLSLYPVLELSENARAILTPQYLDNTGKSERDLFLEAFESMEEKSECLLISDMLGYPMHCPMVIVTNAAKHHGAGAIASVKIMEQAREMLGADEIYVIPSSIHEVICIPVVKECPLDDMCDFIKDINASFVPPNERLSDHPYIYDGEKFRTP